MERPGKLAVKPADDDPRAEFLGIGSFKDQRELVPAEPPGIFRPWRERLEPLGHFDQQCVAGGMAEPVVDLLEPVEIDQKQCAAATSAIARECEA